jgi:signal transduction histidine kinase/HAMP domain-containing protein/ActR/RegA family two-component response regulator
VWKDLTDNVNSMAANLTGQVRNIADVATAVARGDLSKKITVDVKGEILELKSTINTLVDQLNAFAGEVTRVAREVGTEGKLGGQAQVKGVAGVWKGLTDNVNSMAANLTGQVRNIAEVTTAVARGDLSKKITVDVKGEILALKSTINTMVDQLNAFAGEVSRVAKEVGTEGRLGEQALVAGVGGVWKDLTDNVNSMAANLTGQVRNIAEVTTAVARGDLSKTITVDVKGEMLELKSTINTMVDQLNAFAGEVSRVAKEVGTEGKLGGQAQVKGVGGVWKDLTDNVNSMAANLTSQVRSVAAVVTAVANGDLHRKLAVEAKGEVAALADTINGMIDTLALFADQVTNVAREVGSEGKLGGQARVPGAAGLWKDLTDNVNRLAANLTTQVRAIAEVATAVTKGDLTRSITVEASGEVASLKDNINEMIRNLKDTTRKNTEQDWLKTHLARFTRMLQGHRDLVTVSRLILSELTPLVNAQQAAFYVADHRSGDSQLELLAGYAQRHGKSLPRKIAFGEGLVGQCAFEKKRIVLSQAPADYIRIGSALGSAAPVNIVILPVLFEGQVKAVIELASFSRFSEIHQSFLDQLTESIGVVLHTIAANMQTEYLLHQSQSLTAELQAQQEELKKTNDRLEQQALNLQKSESLLKSKQEELRSANEQLQEKARQLSEQMHQVEFKNREIEQARAALEDKAEQLSLSSRYKSEFLANMSHELRTPLNSLLILARLLADNVGGNLTAKQVEFAKTIHSSGAELLALINDILDLAKIESGTVTLNIAPESFGDMTEYVERTFRQMAADKGLELGVSVAAELPQAMQTDAKRLQQILTNLLSNAFKFTSKGRVSLEVRRAASGWSIGHPVLERAGTAVAFSVVDTGIGIPGNKQRLIFEAFQQADGTTSREYGGTGLGLSISRELARLLGGEIRVQSTPGRGSIFTLYLPLQYQPPAEAVPFPARVENDAAALEPAPAPVSATEAQELAPQAASGLADRKVLVVDDDIRNVFALTSALEQHGMLVLHAESGKEAIELLKRSRDMDLVLMDVMMPGLDGFDTMRIVRQLEGYRTLPIVAVTAKAMVGDRERCLEAGATDYIAKPVNVDVLLATLWRTLHAPVST